MNTYEEIEKEKSSDEQENWAMSQFNQAFGFVQEKTEEHPQDEDQIDINLKTILKEYLKTQKLAFSKALLQSSQE